MSVFIQSHIIEQSLPEWVLYLEHRSPCTQTGTGYRLGQNRLGFMPVLGRLCFVRLAVGGVTCYSCSCLPLGTFFWNLGMIIRTSALPFCFLAMSSLVCMKAATKVSLLSAFILHRKNLVLSLPSLTTHRSPVPSYTPTWQSNWRCCRCCYCLLA